MHIWHMQQQLTHLLEKTSEVKDMLVAVRNQEIQWLQEQLHQHRQEIATRGKTRQGLSVAAGARQKDLMEACLHCLWMEPPMAEDSEVIEQWETLGLEEPSSDRTKCLPPLPAISANDSQDEDVDRFLNCFNMNTSHKDAPKKESCRCC